jgi:hypothetical protein
LLGRVRVIDKNPYLNDVAVTIALNKESI